MKKGRKRAERQFLCSTPDNFLHFPLNKKLDLGLHHDTIDSPFLIELTAEEHKHLSLALRLKVGDEVALFDKAQEIKFHGTIKNISKDVSTIEVTSTSYRVQAHISAIIGITDSKTLEFLVEKLTELGINQITFFKAEHSSAQSTSKPLKMDRLLKIRDSAIKQSSAYLTTQIRHTQNLTESLNSLTKDSLKLAMLPPNGDDWTSLNYLLEHSKNVTKIVFAIGPEGGFSDLEESKLRDAGFIASGLSTNTLRVDTACLVTAGSILQYINTYP